MNAAPRLVPPHLTPLERWSSDRSRRWFALPASDGEPMRYRGDEIVVGGTPESALSFLAWADRNGVDLARLYAGPNGGHRVEMLRDDWAWNRDLGDALAHYNWSYDPPEFDVVYADYVRGGCPGFETVRHALQFARTFKVCGCGKAYSREQWGRLDYVGVWDDETEVFELRNCVCGSTLAIVLGPSPQRVAS